MASDITLEQVYYVAKGCNDRLEKIEEHLEKINGHIGEHCREIAVLKDWRSSRASDAIDSVGDLKVEVAKLGALGGGFGIVAIVLTAILKGFGVF